MVEEELLEPLAISEEDLLNALQLVDALARRGELERLIRVSVEHVAAEVKAVAEELERISSKLLPPVGELDLEAMAGALFGALDPIGQLKSWIADQLKAIASWFSSVVDGVVRNLWNTFIKPAIDAINFIVAGIRDRIAGVVDTISKVAAGITDALKKLGEIGASIAGIVSQIVGSVSGIVSGLKDFIASSLAGIVSTINQVIGPISTALKSAVDALARLPDTVRSIVGGVADAIVKTVSGAIAGIGDTVKGMLSGLIATVSDFFGKIGSAVAGLADQVVKGFGTLGSMVGGVLETLKGLWAAVEGAVKSVAEGIGRAVASLGEQVLGALKGFVGTVTDFFGKIGSAVAGLADQVVKGFSGLLEALKSSVADLWGRVQGAVGALAETISKAIGPIAETVSRGFEEMGKWMAQAGQALQQVGVVITGFVNAVAQLPERIAGFFKWIADAIAAVKEALLNFFKDPIGAIRKALEDVGKWVWNALPDWLKGALEAVGGFFQKVYEWVKEGFEQFLKDPAGTLFKALVNAYTFFFKSILPILGPIFDALRGVLERWFGWMKYAAETGELPEESLLAAAIKGFWDAIPEPLKWIIENVQKALESVWPVLEGVWEVVKRELANLLRDPLGTIWGWLKGLAAFFWEKIRGFLGALWGLIQGFVEWLLRTMAGGLQALYNAIAPPLVSAAQGILNGASTLLGGLVAAGKGLGKAFLGVLEGLFTDVAKSIVAAFGELFERMSRGEKVGEADIIGKILVVGSLYTIALDYAASAAKYAGKLMEHVRWGYIDEVRTQMAAWGTGAQKGYDVTIGVYLAPARIFGELGDYLFDLAASMRHQWFELVPRGLSFALEPAFMLVWREILDKWGMSDLPVSPPALPLVVTAAQRLGIVEELGRAALGYMLAARAALPGGGAAEKLNTYLLYRAYPKWFRQIVMGFTETGEPLGVEVKDRFDNPLWIPLGMVYEMPTPSELAEMMVRDAFASYDDYVKWAVRLGVDPNVARFYYFLRFRYPDPRILWNFAMRAAANMLWYVPTEGERSLASADAQAIGAYVPRAPVELNGDVVTAFRMLTTFLKWQDFASFAWSPGWPSDAWVIADTMADIPSKLDARWLVRFGVTDWLAKLGIKAETKPWEMAEMVLEGAPASELTLDVRLLCKFLQATGLHPYYVPLSAVAEAMSAVVDERTLIRTGVTNLYERGLADHGTLSSLLEDMGTITFAVAYFDMDVGRWREGYVNVPLTFLPAERRLITMRAEIDRHLEVFGKVLSEAARGVRELALRPEEARGLLLGFAAAVADRLSSSMREIVGRDVAFAPDLAYFDLWLKYAEVTADIETTYRLRLLAQRVLGWVIYRVATGYVTEEELEQVIQALLAHYKFTEKEAAAVRELARAVNRIAAAEPQRRVGAEEAAKEAIPTLGTLASMAEYIEVPMDYITRILAERRVEKTYAELWLKYVAARAISSEVNTLVSTFRRIVEYFGLPPTLEKQVKELMRAGGWTERELAIFDLDLSLRRAYRILSTFIPTLRQFAGDAMYLGEWEKLFNDLLVARGLEAEKYKAQADYYRKLIKSRKLWRRINSFITELINCYANGIIDESTLRKELEPFKTFGLDDDEINIIVKIAQYRAARYAAYR